MRSIFVASLLLAGCVEEFEAGLADKGLVPPSSVLHTQQHDGHWFVVTTFAFGSSSPNVLHHPDCPCFSRTPEHGGSDGPR